MLTHQPSHSINPFATRYVRPGKLPWLGRDEQSLEVLEQRFITELQSRAAIIGPHGTGKSTLLAHLVPRLGHVSYRESFGGPAELLSPEAALATREIVWLSLRRKDRPLRRVLASRSCWSRGGLLVIDGFEQLSHSGQWLVIALTSLRRMGILATAHVSTALKTLTETNCSLDLAGQVVEKTFQRTGQAPPEKFSDQGLLQSLLTQERGNLREVLMRLYDIAEEEYRRGRVEDKKAC